MANHRATRAVPAIVDGELVTSRDPVARKKIFLTHYRRHGIRILAADAAAVTNSTITHWLHHDPAFREAYEDARLLEAGRMQALLRREAFNGNVTAQRTINAALNPAEFGRQSQVASNGYAELAAEVPDIEEYDDMPFISVEGEVVE